MVNALRKIAGTASLTLLVPPTLFRLHQSISIAGARLSNDRLEVGKQTLATIMRALDATTSL